MAIGGIAIGIGVEEFKSFRIQAHFLARMSQKMAYQLEPGPSREIHFGGNGPYDQRLGYTDLPDYFTRLQHGGYWIAEQARQSPLLMRAMNWGLHPPYREKSQVGLAILDRHNEPLFSARYPESGFESFASIPPILVRSLLYIENRELLDAGNPYRNPVVEWGRLAKAVSVQISRAVSGGREVGGGSTLATQMEKYRHSPNGRTDGAGEKLRQMASASLRAYLDGADTREARQRIVLDYLNTVPLSARAGMGEIQGLGDGLRAWYGRELADIARLLAPDAAAPLSERALAYKQVLSLMLSQRRPSYYLNGGSEDLETLANAYLRLMADAEVIPADLRDAAIAARLSLHAGVTEPASLSFPSRKAANAIRSNLAGVLDLPGYYQLDRLDLVVRTTLDADLQQVVTSKLEALRDPVEAKASGLLGFHMLERGDPRQVVYSFSLFERTPQANVLRVQTDNFDQPFDINSGSKLDLGSTAKLRTLLSYLAVVSELHQRLATLTPAQIRMMPLGRDPITLWAIEYLAGARDRSLKTMLDASMERRYSASPGEAFFTGGGVHHFSNFDPLDNGRIVSVREATRRSINLPFIRLMRDVVRYTAFNQPGTSPMILDDKADPRRAAYLDRFVEQEGRVFLRGFYAKYTGMALADAESLLVQKIRKKRQLTPKRLATVYLTLRPRGNVDGYAVFFQRQFPGKSMSGEELASLYKAAAAETFDLDDRAYIAGVHPLELWLLRYLNEHPGASLGDVLAASGEQLRAAYAWLFKPGREKAQDKRIAILIEQDAYRTIHRNWKRLGYPFESLVPSYATALGASADRPGALAELMGILMNDGMRLPTMQIESLQFAGDTPYETRFAPLLDSPERVLPVEVAQVARGVLAEVINDGTASRLRGSFKRKDGSLLPVGGKTGSGDHRFKIFGRSAELISSRVVERSGTFVFYFGAKHFGVLTAYVGGPAAANYSFTSGLAVQIVKVLAPELLAMTDDSGGDIWRPERGRSRPVLALNAH